MQWDAGRRELGAVGRADCGAERVPAADADHGTGQYRGTVPGGVPAVVGTADRRDRGAGAVRQRRRRQPASAATRSRPARSPARSCWSTAASAASASRSRTSRPAAAWRASSASIAPGDPFEGGFGGGTPNVPGYMVSQTVPTRLKSGLPNTVVRFDPAVGIPLAGTMVGSSSRGPQHEDTHLIKPEIGAPGASVSAIAGSGTGNRAVRRHVGRCPDGGRRGRAAARGHRWHEGHGQGHRQRQGDRPRADARSR